MVQHNRGKVLKKVYLQYLDCMNKHWAYLLYTISNCVHVYFLKCPINNVIRIKFFIIIFSLSLLSLVILHSNCMSPTAMSR